MHLVHCILVYSLQSLSTDNTIYIEFIFAYSHRHPSWDPVIINLRLFSLLDFWLDTKTAFCHLSMSTLCVILN